MRSYVYYNSYDRRVFSQEDIERAFYITTGKYADMHRGEYLRYLNDCFGKSISGYFPGTVEYLIDHDCKIKAIIQYRREHACSVSEAKDAVEKLIAQRKS